VPSSRTRQPQSCAVVATAGAAVQTAGAAAAAPLLLHLGVEQQGKQQQQQQQRSSSSSTITRRQLRSVAVYPACLFAAVLLLVCAIGMLLTPSASNALHQLMTVRLRKRTVSGFAALCCIACCRCVCRARC
jgi:hypothetical protein